MTWTSSDTDIATVDASGTVTAKEFGSATITAEADGVTAVCTVSVVKTAVTGVSLNRTYKEMGVGDSLTLDATVTPGDSTYPDATWTSTNTSVATVSQSGKVTAKTEGAAAIIADVDGKYAVCAVLVSNGANNDNSSDDSDDSTTQTPEPTVSPTASPGPDGENSDDEDALGTGSESSETTPDPQIEKVVITIVVGELPEGTAAVKLPSGEVVELDESKTLKIEVDAEDLDDNGSVELIALSEEGTPLGDYTAGDGQVITIPDSGSAGKGIWQVLMWVFIGIAGVGVVGLMLYLIVKRRST